MRIYSFNREVTMTRLGEYLLGPNDTVENGIYCGNARELSKGIPDESIDLIFTDPVYQNIDDYRWLAEMAARVLKPDSALLVWYATPLKDLTMDALRLGGLTYRWDLSMFLSGPGGSVLHGIVCKKTDCFWFEKGKSNTVHTVWDVQLGITLPRGKMINRHLWAKDQPVTMRWLDAFCEPNEVVFDPFTGGGTVPAVCKMLGRRWLAFEIDSATAEMARERVRNTQPPLFGPAPEQTAPPLSMG